MQWGIGALRCSAGPSDVYKSKRKCTVQTSCVSPATLPLRGINPLQLDHRWVTRGNQHASLGLIAKTGRFHRLEEIKTSRLFHAKDDQPFRVRRSNVWCGEWTGRGAKSFWKHIRGATCWCATSRRYLAVNIELRSFGKRATVGGRRVFSATRWVKEMPSCRRCLFTQQHACLKKKSLNIQTDANLFAH